LAYFISIEILCKVYREIKMKTVKISIVVPCYNVAIYINRCLESIQNQTLKDIEIICVDDASVDNTRDILMRCADQDTRIKVIAKDKNEGAGKARNLGIDNACGEFIVFMDPDDYYPTSDTLEKMYKAVVENNVKIAGGNLIKLNPGGCCTKEMMFKCSEKRTFQDAPFSYGYTRFIYNRDFLVKNKIYFPDYKRFQDPPFFVSAMIAAKNYYAMADYVYVYRVGHKKINWDEQKVLDTLNGLCDILKQSRVHKIYALYVEQIRILWERISGICESGCVVGAVKEKLIDILKNIDVDILAAHLGKKLSYKRCYCDIIKADKDIYDKWKPYIKWPSLMSKIFYKERLGNGRRHILLCGIKIFSYTHKIKIKDYEFVHICNNDKFIKPFVDFCNRNFDAKKHLFLCENCFPQFDFPDAPNVMPLKSLNEFDFSSGHVKKIIVHSLFVGGIVQFLYSHKRLLKHKCLWMIWGGDLYNAKRSIRNDYVRRNFHGYISDTDGDIDVAMKKYDSHPVETHNAGYTFPITKDMIKNAQREKHDYVAIQINNSADDSTLEMLDVLSKFKNENIRIRTILSYGKVQYNDEIIHKGKSIFGDRFEYLNSYMNPAEYAQYMAQNDILILNQNRQQGLGNSFAMLSLGGKLFIRSEVTTYNHFNSKGIRVFDTNKIKDMGVDEFIEYPIDTRKNNQDKAQMFFEDSYLKSLWQPVFNE